MSCPPRCLAAVLLSVCIAVCVFVPGACRSSHLQMCAFRSDVLHLLAFHYLLIFAADPSRFSSGLDGQTHGTSRGWCQSLLACVLVREAFDPAVAGCAARHLVHERRRFIHADVWPPGARPHRRWMCSFNGQRCHRVVRHFGRN